MGGRRAGPQGAAVSDCVNVPFAVEIKRSKAKGLYGPPVEAAWMGQARGEAVREGKGHWWMCVVAGHNSRRPVMALDFWVGVEILQRAGLIPTPLHVDDEQAEETG